MHVRMPGPVPAPCRKGLAVCAAARLRLVIASVSPPFLRFAPCMAGDPPPPRSALIAPFPDPLRQQAEADGAPSPSAPNQEKE